METNIYNYLKGRHCIFSKDGVEYLRYMEEKNGQQTYSVKEVTPLMRTITFCEGDIFKDVLSKEDFKITRKPDDIKIGLNYCIPTREVYIYKADLDIREKLLVGYCQRLLADCLRPVTPIFLFVDKDISMCTYRSFCIAEKATW